MKIAKDENMEEKVKCQNSKDLATLHFPIAPGILYPLFFINYVLSM